MESLVASQRELFGRIARSYDNLRKLGAAKLSAAVVQSALTVLEKKWDKFEEQHDQLQREYGDVLEDSEYLTSDLLGATELAFIEQQAKLLEIERSLASPSAEAKSARATAVPQSSALPKLQLPVFSGKVEDWPAFRDLFESMVIEEDSLTSVKRMQYLKTSVQGDADQLIRDLPATGDNFKRAWNTLIDHFENPRLLVRSYLTAFTALPRLKASSAAGLRRIFHGVLSTVGRLAGIGRPIEDSTDLFVHMVVELLDPNTRREWEGSLGRSTEPPSYEMLREFLQEQLMTQEVMQTLSGESSGKSAERSTEKSGRSVRASHVGGRGTEAGRDCPLCKGGHFLAYCDLYKKKTARERKETVGTHQRCWNCLGRHFLGECSSTKVCGQCSGRHHTTLHDAFATGTVTATGPNTSSTVHAAKRPPQGCGSVLLATARVLVLDRAGAHHNVRALLDPGSETSLMAESLAQRLRLPRTPSSVAIFGVGGAVMQTLVQFAA